MSSDSGPKPGVVCCCRSGLGVGVHSLASAKERKEISLRFLAAFEDAALAKRYIIKKR